MKIVIYAFTISAALAASAFAQALTADEVKTQIVGKSVCMSTARGEVCVRHNADGTSEILSGMTVQSGRWRMQGNSHCVSWAGANERCTSFIKTDSGYETDNGPMTIR